MENITEYLGCCYYAGSNNYNESEGNMATRIKLKMWAQEDVEAFTLSVQMQRRPGRENQ